MTEKAYLDPSLNLRPARWEDLNAVAKLTHDVAEMEGDVSFVLTAEELANEWNSEGFRVERDVFIVETRDGRVVGSEEFYNEANHFKLKADGCVHPDFRWLGIETALLEKIAERAQLEVELAGLGRLHAFAFDALAHVADLTHAVDRLPARRPDDHCEAACQRQVAQQGAGQRPRCRRIRRHL